MSAPNPLWNVWCTASISKYFADSINNKYVLQPVGVTLSRSLQDAKEEKGQWLELKIDGPDVRQRPGKFFDLYYTIEIAIMEVEQGTNFYNNDVIESEVISYFCNCLPVYKYGPSSEPQNDQTYVDFLSLQGNVEVDNLGKNRKGSLAQNSIVANYHILMKGE